MIADAVSATSPSGAIAQRGVRDQHPAQHLGAKALNSGVKIPPPKRPTADFLPPNGGVIRQAPPPGGIGSPKIILRTATTKTAPEISANNPRGECDLIMGATSEGHPGDRFAVNHLSGRFETDTDVEGAG